MQAGENFIRELPTVVVIEDAVVDESLTLEALGGLGFEVTFRVARDGVEAIDLLESTMPDLVLLDIKLPKLNGLEILERIRKDRKFDDVPIVIVSISDEPWEVNLAYERGASAYVFKPADAEQYIQRIRAASRFFLHGRLCLSKGR